LRWFVSRDSLPRESETYINMPKKHSRIRVVLEKPLYESVCHLADLEDISVSQKIRDLIKVAMKAEEDSASADFAQERERTFRRSRGLSHKQVWCP